MNVFELLEQDEGLDALSRVLRNQKQMALAINDEVDQQDGEWRHVSGNAGFFYYRLLAFSGILDDIHDHMDTTDHRLVRETRHIRVIDRKSNTCCKFTVRLLFCVLRRSATPPCLRASCQFILNEPG